MTLLQDIQLEIYFKPLGICTLLAFMYLKLLGTVSEESTVIATIQTSALTRLEINIGPHQLEFKKPCYLVQTFVEENIGRHVNYRTIQTKLVNSSKGLVTKHPFEDSKLC